VFNTIITLYYKLLSNLNKKDAPKNTLSDIITALGEPPKKKTTLEMANDYIAFLTMAELELSYLRADPALMFRGTHYDTFGIPCVVRPEVIYCCLGKN
jgi:hypothetical protein